MSYFQGKVVVLTGAGGGLGQELIRQLLEQGAKMILADHPSMELGVVVAEIERGLGKRKKGSILGLLHADLSDASGCQALFEQSQALSLADILINNAGIAVMGPHHTIPQARWEALMQINLLSPMRLTQLYTPSMIERRGGHLVHISSVAGQVGPEGLAAYAASKFGLRGFGEATAQELRPHGIHVSIVYPFFTRTPILQSEQFGSKKLDLPEESRAIYEPAYVIRESLKSIRRKQLHIFPGLIPKAISTTNRLFPSILPVISRLSLQRLADEKKK
jgi:NAD(P)-dependent dehydrogenase (short-subunit alcohol dehydrogenase family)